VRLLARGRRPEDPAGDGEDGQRGKGFHVVLLCSFLKSTLKRKAERRQSTAVTKATTDSATLYRDGRACGSIQACSRHSITLPTWACGSAPPTSIASSPRQPRPCSRPSSRTCRRYGRSDRWK